MRNVGNQPALNVNATLRSGDNRFRVTDSAASFGDIPACSTCINTDEPFAIEVDPLIPMETSVPCLLLVNGDSYCDTISFRIVIGEIRMFDPIPDSRQPPLYWAYDDVDTNYANHPKFEWIECYGTGTQLILSDDQTVQINLPSGFVWNYYGQTFNQISVCSNGWIAPGYTTSQVYLNTELPSTDAPPNIVAVNWDDLNPNTGGNGVWYMHDAAKHCFVIEWDSVPYFGSTTLEKFEVIIFDTTVHSMTGDNIFITQYATANRYTSSTIGIQDQTQAIAIQCLFDSEYHRGSAPINPGRAIKFITAEPSVRIVETPKPGSNLKSEFSVSVSPNPFRGKVSFTLNGLLSPSIDAHVYDNTGRLVRSLATNQSLSSNTILTWDGKDNEGKAVRAGIYFLRIDNTNHHTITKLILTR